MTPEELDEARVEEARRRWNSNDPTIPDIATGAARLAREGWTPPEPVVDPDLLAFREWAAENAPALGAADAYRKGLSDNTHYARCFLAGARMAAEREQERAKVLEDRLADLVERVFDDSRRGKRTGVNASEMISARVALAKYQGEA